MASEPNPLPTTVFRRCWQPAHELPDTGETVVFDEGKSELLVLNDTAAAVWYLLDAKSSVDEIVGTVREVYPEPKPSLDEVRSTVLRFLEEMLERKAIAVVRP